MRITLCGSTRFLDLFLQANIELTKQGHTVYTISMALPKSESGEEPGELQQVKENLDLVHLDKILNSDAIVVLGKVEGQPYIGASTRREIVWAQMHNKQVFFGLEDFSDPGFSSNLMRPTVIEGSLE
jgi:hypothetical protein